MDTGNFISLLKKFSFGRLIASGIFKFKYSEPWLPPVTYILNGRRPSKEGSLFVNFSIGFPTKIIFFSLMEFNGNPKKIFLAKRCRILLDVPMTVFCSCKKSGFLHIHAARPTGRET